MAKNHNFACQKYIWDALIYSCHVPATPAAEFDFGLDQENTKSTLEHLGEGKNEVIQQWQVGPAEQMVFEVAQSCVSSLTREQNQELLEGWEKSQEKEIKI